MQRHMLSDGPGLFDIIPALFGQWVGWGTPEVQESNDLMHIKIYLDLTGEIQNLMYIKIYLDLTGEIQNFNLILRLFNTKNTKSFN